MRYFDDIINRVLDVINIRRGDKIVSGPPKFPPTQPLSPEHQSAIGAGLLMVGMHCYSRGELTRYVAPGRHPLDFFVEVSPWGVRIIVCTPRDGMLEERMAWGHQHLKLVGIDNLIGDIMLYVATELEFPHDAR